MTIAEPAELVGVVKTCPRPGCGSTDVRWRYYNNPATASRKQPRYGCNACNKTFTYGGSIRLTARDKEVAKKIARTAKAASKAARADKKAALQTAKRAAKASTMTVLLDKSTHPTLSASSREVEMMPQLADNRVEFLSRVDGVDVTEQVEEGSDDEHVGLELEALVNGAPDVNPGTAFSETWVDAAGLDSGLSLLDMWDVYRGEIESGLSWMSDSCGDRSVFGDSGLAWMSDSCGDGSAENHSGLAWMFHSCGDGSSADSGVGGSEEWDDSGSAGSESEMEWADSLIVN